MLSSIHKNGPNQNLKIKRHTKVEKKSTRPHLDGVNESHETQAAEVNVQGVAQRPDKVVPGRILASVAHVHHSGSSRFTGRLAVGERGAVRGEVV